MRRTRTPPWLSIILLQSLTPRSRLIAERTKPPKNLPMTITVLIAPAFNGENGVMRKSAAPIRMAVSPPPTSPSTVLEGLTAGDSLVRPKSLPKTYWKTSLICTTTIR